MTDDATEARGMTFDETRADIAARNAGEPCLTIWKDGSYLHHGYRDAEIATLCEPDAVLMTLRLRDLEWVEFIPLQKRVDLAEKLFGSRRVNKP